MNLRPYRTALVCTAALLLAPRLFPGGLALSLLSQMGIATIACLSYNLLMGQGGMLSFGHALYTGLGAFAAMHALNQLSHGAMALPVALVPLVGGLAGMGVALLLGYLSTRQAGTSFAMISLGLGELVYALAPMVPGFFGGEGGVAGNRVAGPAVWGISWGPALQLYYLIGAYTLLSAALLYALTGTPLGRLLNAVRDNPERVAFIGFNPQRVRYLAFVIAGFFAGIAGGLAALNFEIVNAEALGAARSGAYLLFTFLGGTGVFWGPVLGAVLMVLSTALFSEWTQAWLLYLGLLFMGVVMLAPQGLAGILQAHARVLRNGMWRGLLVPYTGLLLSGSVMALGLAALVEMTYHQQLHAALGTQLRFLGLALDTALPAHWVAAALLGGAGLLPFLRLRRAFANRYQRLQDDAADAALAALASLPGPGGAR